MEKVVTNLDVLYEIFQYLNLEELLRLTRVCSQFRTAIVDFLWKNKYKHIEVFKTTHRFKMLLTNNVIKCDDENEVGFECIKEDKVTLSKTDIYTFLQLVVNNIRKLVLSAPTTYYTCKSVNHEAKETKNNEFIFSPVDFGVTFDKRHGFVNLTIIEFRHIVITERDLRLLNESSKNLEEISLDNCLNSNEKTLVIGEDIKIPTVQKMKNLKFFQINVLNSVDKDMSYDLNTLLSKLSVKQFKIQIHNFAITDEDDNQNGMAAKRFSYLTNCCEDLTIGYFRSQRIFRRFNNLILNHFKSLKRLVMESWALISVNEEFFKKLAKTCSQLECLKLQNFEFNGFSIVASLSTLILKNCTGLMWREVKSMLSDMNLRTFSIVDTEYIGIFEYFNVTATLEHLRVTKCQRNHLKKLFDINDGHNLKNLTSLIWHDNFAQVPIYVATSCPKLKTLIAEPTSLLINNLYSLNSLEKLTLRVGRKIRFSKIMIILNHTNLKHLTLTKLKDSNGYDECNDYLIDYDIYDQELLEFEDKRINLIFINISLNSYFKIAQDFWFNLLNNNSKLQIMIRYNRCLHNDHTFLKFIINHRKFPKRLSSINISGHIMEIMEFRENFDTAVEKIKSFSNIYKEKEDRGYILL